MLSFAQLCPFSCPSGPVPGKRMLRHGAVVVATFLAARCSSSPHHGGPPAGEIVCQADDRSSSTKEAQGTETGKDKESQKNGEDENPPKTLFEWKIGGKSEEGKNEKKENNGNQQDV